MDTAHKVAQLAAERGLDLVAVGVPKTIDNDVGDCRVQADRPHARLWQRGPLLGADRAERQRGERRLLPRRPGAGDAGHGAQDRLYPAAARLADPDREMPLLIAMTESGLTLAELADAVNDMLRERGRCLLVVSEGFEVGDLGERKDSFRPHRVWRQPDDGRSRRWSTI